jgi:hypothetical protein
VIKGAQLIGAELVEKNQVKLLFDKPIDENTIIRGDFKFFSNRNIGIVDIQNNTAKLNEVLLTLSANVVEGNYIAVSYFPGSLKAIDGSIADPFGPHAIPNAAEVIEVSSPIVNNSTIKIYPNPASDIINIEHQWAPYKVAIYNSLGMKVFADESISESMSLDVSRFKRGIYMIRLTSADNVSDIQKFLLK